MKYRITQDCAVHIAQLNQSFNFKKGEMIDGANKKMIDSLTHMQVCEKMDQNNYDNKMMPGNHLNK